MYCLKRIYFNREPVVGPWGGGNKTLSNLVDRLKYLGYDVVFDLNHKNIDMLVCFDPRQNNRGITFGDLIDYRKRYRTKILQRVGDIGMHGKPDLTHLVIKSIQMSDHVIFPSVWSKDRLGFTRDNHSIIENGPHKIFFDNRKVDSNIHDPVNVVSHHWSDNSMKGFDFYKMIDSLSDIRFTYIGRKPNDITFKSHIEPLDMSDLSRILPTFDVYVTASKYETGANHVLEAMACGLPVLYHADGGSVVEYCSGFGLKFDSLDSFISSLDIIRQNYCEYRVKVLRFNCSLDYSIDRYIGIIECNF